MFSMPLLAGPVLFFSLGLSSWRRKLVPVRSSLAVKFWLPTNGSLPRTVTCIPFQSLTFLWFFFSAKTSIKIHRGSETCPRHFVRNRFSARPKLFSLHAFHFGRFSSARLSASHLGECLSNTLVSWRLLNVLTINVFNFKSCCGDAIVCFEMP